MKPFIVLLFALAFICAANAQTGNVFVMQTFKTIMPEGGSIAERDSLIMEWVEFVTKNNDKILHEYNYRHYYGKDSKDWIVLTEYKSLADFSVADSISSELMKKHWPDVKKRAEYNQKLWRYFDAWHSDEIYRILPKFTK